MANGRQVWTAGVYFAAGEPKAFVSDGIVCFEDENTVVVMKSPEQPFRSTFVHKHNEVYCCKEDAHSAAVRQLTEMRAEVISKIDLLIEKHRGLQGVVSVG